MFRDPEGGYQSFKLGPRDPYPWDEDDDEERPLSKANIQRAREAVAIVMKDVEAELGNGAVTVVVGTLEELHDDLANRGLEWIRSSGQMGSRQ